MSDKPPDDKNGLLELLKKLWLPIAGFIGAVTLSYNYYKMWSGDQQTVTYVTAGTGLVVLLVALGWVGFSTKTVTREAERPFAPTKKEKISIYSRPCRWIARVSLAIIIVGVASEIWSIIKYQQQHQQELKDKVVVVIATFDGPEKVYSIRDQILEQLREATKDYDDVVIIPVDEVVTVSRGSEYARKLGKKKNADLVIWAWYRLTENPNISIHIENLSPTKIYTLNESEYYQPQASLEDLEAFKIQRQLGSETSTLISFLSGLLSYKIGDYQTSLERFEQILLEKDISTYIEPYDLYFYIGYLRGELEQRELSIEAYNLAISANPNVAAAYNNRGLAYSGLKQYERAIQDYDKAIELDPNDVVAYNNRGVAYDDLKEYERAIQDYDKAIELDPNYAAAYNNRGVAYYYLKQYERAIQDYDKAIELDPNYAAAYNNRGLAYDDLKEYERAIQDYDKAIELDPNYTDVYYNRGLAYQKLGKTAEAEADFKKYEELTGKKP